MMGTMSQIGSSWNGVTDGRNTTLRGVSLVDAGYCLRGVVNAGY